MRSEQRGNRRIGSSSIGFFTLESSFLPGAESLTPPWSPTIFRGRWTGGREAEGAGLENRYTVTPYREFESHPVRARTMRNEEQGVRTSISWLLVARSSLHARGWVAEWLKAHAWKACGRATVSRVRISPHPLTPSELTLGRRFLFGRSSLGVRIIEPKLDALLRSE